jgi:hypothetical protein
MNDLRDPLYAVMVIILIKNQRFVYAWREIPLCACETYPGASDLHTVLEYFAKRGGIIRENSDTRRDIPDIPDDFPVKKWFR